MAACLTMLLLGLSGLTASANITVGSFKATPQADNSILVEWETATELTTQGFNLYRATSDSGPWDQRVDQQAAKGDGFTGATYEYRDTNVQPGVRYYYLLEELTSAGIGDRAGPVNAGIGLPSEPTSTATVTRTPTATNTATATTAAGGSESGPATATRQFTNTPMPFATSAPGPEATWTPAPAPTATPPSAAEVTTPTPSGGLIVAPTAAPTEIPVAAAPPATAEPAPAATDQPTLAPTVAASTPTTAAPPQVFAQATTSPALLDAQARPTPQAAAPSNPDRNTRLVLLLGGSAIVLAGLLGGAGLLIWRKSRSR